MKFKLVRMVGAAALGSLLWAGCSTPQNVNNNYSDVAPDSGLSDLTQRQTDTHPERRIGLADRSRKSSMGIPIYDPAGSDRR